MSNFANYENIIKLFQSFVETILFEKGRKCAIFSPETEIVQRIVNYTNKILESLFEKYLQSLNKKHYWELISQNYYKNISVKYIASLEYLVNARERAFIWIFLELFCVKQMDKLLVNFRICKEIQKEDLYRLIHCIQKIMFIENYTIKSSLFEDFALFSDPASLEKKDVYEEMRSKWSRYYTVLVDYKRDVQALERNKANKMKNHLGININGVLDSAIINSNDSTPITKSNSNYELTLNDYNDHQKSHKSELVYQNHYKEVLHSFSFEKTPEKIASVKDQDYKCAFCSKNISQGLYFIGNNSRYCYYFNKWCCSDCVSYKKSVIPSKILDSFDFNEYQISKEGIKTIDTYFSKPVIRLSYQNPIVKRNRLLFDTLIVRREIHLIHDMICNTDLVEILLSEDNMNFVLRDNIFSLKNLIDIHSEKLIIFFKKIRDALKVHVNGCEKCLEQGKTCKICKSQEKLFYFDLKKTKVCSKCKGVYHIKCFKEKGCPVCSVHDLFIKI